MVKSLDCFFFFWGGGNINKGKPSIFYQKKYGVFMLRFKHVKRGFFSGSNMLKAYSLKAIKSCEVQLFSDPFEAVVHLLGDPRNQPGDLDQLCLETAAFQKGRGDLPPLPPFTAYVWHKVTYDG